MRAVDADITVASTIDSEFYRDEKAYALARERIFARSWQWIGDLGDVAEPGSLSPRELLPGLIDEPLLLARDAAGTLRCLSNVCTHRGNILVRESRKGAEQIRCGYHSRRFDLSGRMTFMPEFAQAKNFPSASDHLPKIPFSEWAGQSFAAIDPMAPLEAFIGEMKQRLAWLTIDRFQADAESSHDYAVRAHWALYVENYLEELHVPFVHPGLSRAVDVATYAHELFRYSSLQLALAKEGEVAFDPPPGAHDHGRRIAAYYWWIFPNLMLNFYPWGLSVNRVVPELIRRKPSIARASNFALTFSTRRSAGRARAERCTTWSWRTKPWSRPCSAVWARASTGTAATRQRASAARITFTVCCASFSARAEDPHKR